MLKRSSSPSVAARASASVGSSARAYGLAAAALALTWGGLLLWLSMRRYAGYNAGMLDLGNMAQAIASVWRGQPLVFTYVDGPTSRLAFHVELFYYLLAPLWALWPDPRALLAAQAALYALGALPAYRLGARAAAQPLGGLGLAALYLLYPVAQTAVLFDLHGDTLAMPLLLFALAALERRAWRPYALWLALALSCKFYVALPVALLGLVLAATPETRRAGLLTTLAGAGYGALAFLVVRPLFTTAATSSAHRGLNYLSFYFGQFGELATTLLPRLLSAAVVFGPALLLAWGGRKWLLPALPMAAAALLSTGPGGSYDYRYHHYATVVPFVILAAAMGMRQAREAAALGRRSRPWRSDLIFSGLVVLLLSAVLVDTPLNPLFWMRIPGYGLDHAVYGVTPRDALKERFLAEQVPAEVPLAASMFLGPRLVERDTLYLTRYADDPGGERLPTLLAKVDYAVTDALFDWRVVERGVVAGAAYERAEITALLQAPGWGLTAMRDGLLLFAREPQGAAMAQQARLLAAPPPGPPLATLGPATLLRAEIAPLGGRRYRASFIWQLAGAPPPGQGAVAVSQLAGVEGARIVHLPSYLLLPIATWQPGQAVAEQFELELPADLAPGRYSWQVGWYNLNHPEAHATDARSRLGAEAAVAEITVE